jgi:hypothetical protein
MKLNTLIVGLIALIMLAIPVMATPTAAEVTVNGNIVQTLTISTDATSVGFGSFAVGDNRVDTGTLTITSAFIPNWQVTAATSDGYGYMRTGAGAPATGTYLTSKLQEYNWLGSTPTWQDVQGLSFTGSSSTSMTQTYKQNVLISDAPGDYSTVITYTIAAV